VATGSSPSAACFDTPASFELTWRGRKLAGGAQARRPGALLQHGALPLAPHAAQLTGLLAASPADLAARMATLDEALGRAVRPDELAAALVAGCAETWGIAFELGELSHAERATAAQLRAEKYAGTRWTHIR
jgi:lipoate-protein ligase A